MADYSANIALKVDQSGLNQVRDLEERLKAIRKSIKAIGQGGIGNARSDGNTGKHEELVENENVYASQWAIQTGELED